ncbi:MAG: cell division ATP-binding protein FtsE [Candidatus Buchananbacteria bacterium RBG_13_36_9]|uniref:Cell division ATP-binding protein FtsE n=1 Tax=Candidatus Buchananbacteria bacterium RBG_13_36_9 TaxID=1797530 RepID=A0A1G1XM89_9BACT|nr:MAG: cell division ATP-binding protein FtsE [Candidatus Buchananbacteria bacterium RBG_13_36_9]
MINFKKVSKIFFPKTVALKDLNLHIEPKEFVSVVGQSGAGKSTIIKLLNVQERPSAGQISVGGWDITDIHPKEIPLLRRQIGVVYQDFKLLPKKTVFENVAFALEVCGISSKRINQVVPQVLKIVGLKDKTDRYPYQISGGEIQRAAIARALVHRPKILLADEPTGNLDSLNSKDIIDLLLKINEFGTTILLVTHNKEVVNRIKKRVVLLDNGEVISDQEEGKYIL